VANEGANVPMGWALLSCQVAGAIQRTDQYVLSKKKERISTWPTKEL